MTSNSLSAVDLESVVPDVSKTVTFDGLDGPVRILRDKYGIPHVKAESSHDAFFGQGYATAQDRLWHMDHDRLRAYGQWASVVGSSGVEHDVMMRRFQIAASVEQDWEALNTDTRAMFEAYCDGVNAFIQSSPALPVEYRLTATRPEPWRPQDSLAVFKVRHIMMGVFEGKLWRADLVNTLGAEKAASLLKGYQPGQLVIVPPDTAYHGPVLDGLRELSDGLDAVDLLRDEDSGSNNWAVAGSRTRSGKPLIAGDPHRGLDTPNVYYQNHISCSDFDVIGLSFPGCPGFPHFGHNASVAWCVTHAQADYQDLFLERFRESEGVLEYESQDGWKTASTRREIIRVKGKEPVVVEVVATHHGQVIMRGEDGQHGVAFRYTSTASPNLGFEAMLKMLYASSADDLDESMRLWVDPCNNFVYGDVHGDIGYLNRGQLPVRTMANAWLPVPGWTGEHDWRGTVPFEELTRSRNPETGFIVTANNRIVGQEYPHYIALDFSPDHRARRIVDRLKGLTGATVEDMASIHSEVVSIPARVYARRITDARPLGDPSAEARDRLAGWDGAMDKEAIPPTIYSAFRSRLHRRLVGGILGPLAEKAGVATGRGASGHLRQLASRLVNDALDDDTSLLPEGSDWNSVIELALAQGVEDLKSELGTDMDSWTWGSVHYSKPSHPLSSSFPEAAGLLDPPSVPMSGDGDTPHAAGYSEVAPYTVTSTSVARYVWDTADWDNSRWIVPLGSSGHPGSRHFADQTRLWGRVELIRATYSWDKIEAEAESAQSLVPTGSGRATGGRTYEGSHQQ